MQWIRIKSADDLPKKPGLSSYEQIVCLIYHKGEAKVRVWNCEHGVWDDEDGDDFYCDALAPTHYAIIEDPAVEDLVKE